MNSPKFIDALQIERIDGVNEIKGRHQSYWTSLTKAVTKQVDEASDLEPYDRRRDEKLERKIYGKQKDL